MMAASEYKTIANVAWDVMSVDLSATQLLRSMYHNSSVILEALDYFSVQFAPSLCGILRSRTPPTPQQLQLCTLPSDAASSSTWIIYLQFLEKDGEIIVCVY